MRKGYGADVDPYSGCSGQFMGATQGGADGVIEESYGEAESRGE
jgi:hypothetical protein